MQTLIAIAAIAAIVALLVANSRGSGSADTAIAITLILWMVMLGTAIWSAALIAVKRTMIMRLPPAELENALATVNAVSVPTFPIALLTAAAFLAGGMVLLPILLSDWFKKRRGKGDSETPEQKQDQQGQGASDQPLR